MSATTVISWAAFWSATGAVLSGAAAALLAMSGMSAAGSVAVLIAVGIVVLAVAPKLARSAELFGHLAAEDEALVLRALSVAIASHTLLAVAWAAQPALWPVWTTSLAGLAGATYATTCAVRALVAKREAVRRREAAAAEEARQRQAAAAAAAAEQSRAELEQSRAELERWDGAPPVDSSDPRLLVEQVLAMGQYTGLIIGAWEPIGGHHGVPPLGIRVLLRARPSGRKELVTLSEADAEPLARLFQAVLRTPIETNWVRIEKLRGAGAYALTVTIGNPFDVVYPYTDPVGPQSIKDPKIIGYDITGRPHRERINQHSAKVGSTRSGKTSLIQVERAYDTLCHDSVRWIGGTEKLFDSLAGWITPYLGTGLRLPFDLIASGPRDTALMLATSMVLARARQNAPYEVRAGFKTLNVELDEASFFLVQREIKTFYQGRYWTPSQLTLNLLKGAGSADIWGHLASQRGTGDNWGEEGTNINANILLQSVFKTGDAAEIGRLLDNYKTPVPTTKGELLLRPPQGDDSDVAVSGLLRLKAPYIQESDPSKPKLHDGPTLADISWSRRNLDNTLDAWSAAMAGEWYAKRRTDPDQIWAYLTEQAVDLTEQAAPTAGVAEPTGHQAAADPAPAGGTGEQHDGKQSVYDMVRATLRATLGDPNPNPADVDGEGTGGEEPTATTAPVPSSAPAASAPPVLSAAPSPKTGSTAAASVMAAPTVMRTAEARTRPERIVAVVAAADGPLSTAQIRDALIADGDDGAAGANVVSNALGQLVGSGHLDRPVRDRYTLSVPALATA
ncbi:hypothetical protein L6E12_31465 [Actinokineospora sp. PR83]|uniref:hypothetical protein n=1 Tax=Actinokineospora sp. PR83 TaxID=2884908 RepID=UPI001F41A953|nr:hypothetical protein [Actinokineospora sp. PR83]MCG8920298.1 hypothetical protein [Actinokineospora sp. PR83]